MIDNVEARRAPEQGPSGSGTRLPFTRDSMSRSRTSLLIFIALVLLFFAGPRASVDMSWDDVQVGQPVEEWLAAKEAAFDDLRPGVEAEVIWADSSKARTSLSIIYLHGFSASRLEAVPYPDSIAAALGANLFYPRIAGHGRDGAAMGEASAEDWLQSTVEAIRVGEAIGEKVVVIGLSTGGTLAAWASLDEELSRNIAAQIWISPNFAVADSRSDMLLWPWGRVLLHAIQGDSYSWTPQNELHAALGTHNYPSDVLIDVVGIANAVQDMDFGRITAPTMLIYSPTDRVVNPEVTIELYDRLGTHLKDSVLVRHALDNNDHVLVGDALGPENTIPIAHRTVEWLHAVLQQH